jgi:hypothetical protein
LKDNEEICSNNGLFIESDDNEEKELRREENDGNESTYSNDSNENLEHRKPSSFRPNSIFLNSIFLFYFRRRMRFEIYIEIFLSSVILVPNHTIRPLVQLMST